LTQKYIYWVTNSPYIKYRNFPCPAGKSDVVDWFHIQPLLKQNNQEIRVPISRNSHIFIWFLPRVYFIWLHCGMIICLLITYKFFYLLKDYIILIVKCKQCLWKITQLFSQYNRWNINLTKIVYVIGLCVSKSLYIPEYFSSKESYIRETCFE